MDVDQDELASAASPAINTQDLKDIPICWILRNGKLLKMFKCRFCPHVNQRRTNIQEHERMHSDRPAKAWESVQPHQRLVCELCNYTCNNAGVLSSHSKVHAADYARLCAIVDPYRKEEDQMRELVEKLNLNPSVLFASDASLGGADSSAGQEPATPDGNEARHALSIRNLLKTSGGVKGALLEERSENGVDAKRATRRLGDKEASKEAPKGDTHLLFCQTCPARFLFANELNIHNRFHNVKLTHQCPSCSYTARHHAHLKAHLKVHTHEYHERTTVLLKTYPIHPEYMMPLHTCLKNGNDKLWVVPSEEISDKAALVLTAEYTTQSNCDADQDEAAGSDNVDQEGDLLAADKGKHCCAKCPAKFFKPATLQYHVSLHGANHPHKCRVCDYAVKTYGNLAKHEMIHGPREKLKRYHRDSGAPADGAPAQAGDAAQPSKRRGTDKNEADVDSSVNDESDNIDESMYQGRPDFVYPTYLTKNGRVKEKRFKCFKCPSAFEKREQYRVHLSLHGSKQRYSCNKCDYSVKYFANYVQHVQKHSKSETARAAAEDGPVDDGEALDDASEGANTPDKTPRQSPLTASPQRSMKTINRGPLALSMADRQTMMVMQQRRASGILSSRTIDKNYWCLHCPYSNPRRDGIDSHMRRHVAVSGVRSVYVCDYCDYTVPTQHFLREHTKIHFAVDKLPRPDTFMTCNKLELWSGCDNQQKQLIFQDNGTSHAMNRFVPALIVEEDGETKVFVNPSTGETLSLHSNGDVAAGQPEWDTCSEGTNKSEMAPIARNGEVAPSQSSMTDATDASDTASSTGCSSRSSAADASDAEDEPHPAARPDADAPPPLPPGDAPAADVPAEPAPSANDPSPCLEQPKTEHSTDVKED